MRKTSRVPARSTVKPEDTWDLRPLFKDDAAWERAHAKLERDIAGLSRFKGKLGGSPNRLRDCYAFEVEFNKVAEKLRDYAFLKSSEDVSNSHYQGMLARYVRTATHAEEAASYIAPEIQAIPKPKMDRFLRSPVLKDFRFRLEKLLRHRPHTLSAPEERILAMQGEIAGTPNRIFGQLNDADLKFGHVRNERGQRVELTQGTLMSLYHSRRRDVREEAFEKFYDGYEAHANTIAATLNGAVLQDVYYARVRNHRSCLEAALFDDKVPVSVYDRLIDAVHSHLDTIHRYLELRRRALRLKKLHIYDCYVPIVKRRHFHTPYPKAVEMICEALAPLGSEYCRTLEAGLRDRWVDRYENRGKRSGAFSAGGYSGPPYILTNYREDILESVFTLAHEAGHSMHTYYSARHQPFQYYDYSIFVAEVASTFNEQLLVQYLIERAPDKPTRTYLINREIDEIRGTLIRQTMFAEFEKVIHAVAEANEPLTLERLREEYRKLLLLYFGPRFTLDDQLSLEGLRIPHFYHSFYVYKYATGLAAAIALVHQVTTGGTREREHYLGMLKAGGSKYPLGILRDAGVDMETPEPVNTAMARFKGLVEELEQLI
ncbi:MAG: oligoendopeptidase F [Candidatus Hydrogenedentes bacterium]|nr:oligoendopeptidase F [Candidatus Hydrogenedentota bacterium]